MDETSRELYLKLSKLRWLLQKYQLKRYAAESPLADPTRGQGRILALLKMQDGISTKELSYLLDIKVSSLNELLAKLEKNEYITREPSGADKRIMLVKLTEKGRTEQQQKKDHIDIFHCLSEEERKNLGEYLSRIISTLEAEVGTGQDDQVERLRAMRHRMGEEMVRRLSEYGDIR